MSTRSKRRLASEINVVPYIDVMLVLLIIFMVTAPLLSTGVEVDLPNAPAQTLDQDEDPIVLTVNRDGDMYLNVGDNPAQALAPADVTRIAATVIRARPDAPVAVKGDGNGSYGNVVRGMVLLQRAGAKTVGLLTDDVDNANDKDAG